MSGFQNLKKLLAPLVRGLPLVIFIFVVGQYGGKKLIQYSPTMYRSMAKIRLDDQNYGFSSGNLYKDFDVFSTVNKVETEVEVLKSPLLIGRALENTDLNVIVHRVGKLKKTALHADIPFLLNYEFSGDELYDKELTLDIRKASGGYTYSIHAGEKKLVENIPLGKKAYHDGASFTVSKNVTLLAKKEIKLDDKFSIHIHSLERIIDIVRGELDVTAIDKDVAVVRVVFKDENPDRAADVINVICETYIKDYVETKSAAARATLEFTDARLEEAYRELIKAEAKLEEYKLRKGVVNIRQETETGLRKQAQLRVQLINMQMNERAILDLEEYVAKGDYFNETAVNFGYGDLLMTELVKKLELYTAERRDLLLKYTPEHEKIKAIDKKIGEIKDYIREGIKSAKRDIETKKAQIESSLEVESHEFDDLPTKERELRILERNFKLSEETYNFLSQKRIEAGTVSQANIAFHRIIQRAKASKTPVSPNKVLIRFVIGLMSLMLAIGFIYGKKWIQAKIQDQEDVERISDIPFIQFPVRNSESLRKVALHLDLQKFFKTPKVITFISPQGKEGKSKVAAMLAREVAKLGYKVGIARLGTGEGATVPQSKDNLYAIDISEAEANATSAKSYLDILMSQKSEYDLLVIDAPSLRQDFSSLHLAKVADMSVCMLKANVSTQGQIYEMERIRHEYKLEELYFLLNTVPHINKYLRWIRDKFPFLLRLQKLFKRRKKEYNAA